MDEDRLSELPDPILQQILSSIDINQAVQSTILSKRYKKLWLSLSDLHFSLARHAALRRRVNLNNRQSAQAFSLRFSAFVSHFLSHRDDATALRTFRLSFDSRLVHADAPFIEKCILYAVNHGVESLHLHALCRPALRLPAAFFASKTLRQLNLTHFTYGIYIPQNFSLPNLKALYLENTVLLGDDGYYSFLKEPFSGFPELERLSLRRFSLNGLVVIAPKLRFLEIVQDRLYSAVMEEISCPLLTSFSYEGYFPLECSKIDLPRLQQVYLNVYKKIGSINNRRMALKCVRMLQQLGNAMFVTLTLDTVKVLEMDRGLVEQSPSPFPYMKRLKLRRGRREITKILERVMNYLKEGNLYCDSLMVEIPEGVFVVQKNSDDFDEDHDELQLEQLFETEEETPSQILNFGVFEELFTPKFGQDGRVKFSI